MVKRGPWLRPQASEGEAQHGPFCWTRCVGRGNERPWRGLVLYGLVRTDATRARRSASIFGPPPRERDFQRQYRRKPVRCQRTGERSVALLFRRPTPLLEPGQYFSGTNFIPFSE